MKEGIARCAAGLFLSSPFVPAAEDAVTAAAAAVAVAAVAVAATAAAAVAADKILIHCFFGARFQSAGAEPLCF